MRQSRKAQTKAQEPSARAKLSAAFLEAFEKDFQQNGVDVIKKMREIDPTRYAELAGKLITTIEARQDGVEKANTVEEIAIYLLRNVGLSEDLMTPAIVEETIKANDIFVAELQRIRDAAEGGPLQ
jgi:hypothetical protein